MFDNWITEISLEFWFQTRRGFEIEAPNIKKGREFGKIFFLRFKLWRVPKEENLSAYSGICLPEVCQKSLPFLFLHRIFYFSRIGQTDFGFWILDFGFFINLRFITRHNFIFNFHASVAYRQRQAVCKTVVVSAVKVQILPDAFQFWILDFEF